MFEFLKTKPANKKKTVRKTLGNPNKLESKGTVKIDKFEFNIRELNPKGFILDPYDKDIVITGQKFHFEIDAMYSEKEMKGRAEAVVTKIAQNALAAAFTTKFFR